MESIPVINIGSWKNTIDFSAVWISYPVIVFTRSQKEGAGDLSKVNKPMCIQGGIDRANE